MRGFVILFAVLLVSITLTISLSLFNITFKQLILSTVARDSQFAYFATDSALDCTRHWDVYPKAKNSDGSTDRPFGYLYNDGSWKFIPPSPLIGTIDCGGSIVLSRDTSDPNVYQTNFTLIWESLNPDSPTTCAKVQVNKYVGGVDQGTTIIKTQGYNIYDEGSGKCPAQNNRAVERALKYEE